MNKKENMSSTNLPIICRGKIDKSIFNKININKNKSSKEKEQNQKNSKITTITLIVFITTLLLSCGCSMAKSIEEYTIKSKAEIAEPILVVENNPSIDITAANNYGEYTFIIKNYNEQNKVTQTDLKYYIEILSNTDDSINIELYQNDNKIDLTDNKTDYIQISKNQKEEREYKIKITYDKNKSNTINDIMEKIQVKVHTEQIKA